MGSTSPADPLLGMLAELSWTQGPVTLASGQTSDFYIDCKQTALNASGSVLIGERVWRIVRELRDSGMSIRGIGGLTLGADPIALATAVASASSDDPVHAFIIRKEPKGHGTEAWLEGGRNVPSGAAVVIAEDVITTGGSTLKAIERTRQSGLQPHAVICLVDREQGGVARIRDESGLDVHALFTRQDFETFRTSSEEP